LEVPTTKTKPKEIEMKYSTLEPWQAIDLNGIEYEEMSLYDYFMQMSDPRKDRGKRYSLVTLLVLIFLAKIGGADSPSAIADWVKARSVEMKELLHLTYPKLPHHNTYRRVFAQIVDEEAFEQVARHYSQGQQSGKDIKVLAFDGKRERGTAPPGESQGEALLAVYAPEQQVVLAQGRIEAEENEIPVAQRLLGEVDVSGKVLVGDALHTQRALSEQIKKSQGDFLWTVKENQPAAYQAIETLFTHPDPVKEGLDFRTARKVNKGHGRIEERTLTVSSLLNTYLDWPGVQQVFRLERKFTFVRKDQITRIEQMVHYGLTSLSRQQASPEQLLRLKRLYWQIETGLHYRRDVTFHEDATRMSHAHATRNLATVHNTILNLFSHLGLHNVAQTRRFFDANPHKAFSLLISAHPRL
jgi:predicted transposase YbfD/YdcC